MQCDDIRYSTMCQHGTKRCAAVRTAGEDRYCTALSKAAYIAAGDVQGRLLTAWAQAFGRTSSTVYE